MQRFTYALARTNNKAGNGGQDIMSTSQTRTLRRALDACGGKPEKLARVLGVSIQDLSEWLLGRKAPPMRVYLDALDVVARGPLRRSA